MANIAVQLAADTAANEVSEGMSHCTTVSFRLHPLPTSSRLLGNSLLGKEPFATSPRTVCKEEPLGDGSNLLGKWVAHSCST